MIIILVYLIHYLIWGSEKLKNSKQQLDECSKGVKSPLERDELRNILKKFKDKMNIISTPYHNRLSLKIIVPSLLKDVEGD